MVGVDYFAILAWKAFNGHGYCRNSPSK
jgi:hypothetical protein